MTLSQIGVIPHVCVKGTSAYRKVCQSSGFNVIKTLERIFDLHRVTPPWSFAIKLTGPQGRFEDATCTHLQALTPM